MKQLENYFAGKKINKVLEVGAGTGDFIKVLKELFPGTEITGIDPNTDSLETAAKRYPEVQFFKMQAESLVFKNNAFDVAAISMALHHLSDVPRSLAEMRRVVKSGGWIIVAELFSDNLNPAQQNHKMYHHFRSKIDRLNGIQHNETFPKNEILKRVSDSGIKILFDFEVKYEANQNPNRVELDERIQKMKVMLESIKGLDEYEILKPEIENFRKKVLRFGFQPATRVVLVGQSN